MPKAHVIGLGKSGVAAARLLHQQGWQAIASDAGLSETLRQQQQQLEQEGIAVKLGYRFDPSVDPVDLVVVSPGVPWDIPPLVQARDMGMEAIGEMELAWRYLQGCPWVAVTGTNGKTTTTSIIAAIFQAAGCRAPACGNIGYAACDLAREAQAAMPDWTIAEVSSYQIEASSTLAPHISVWTTFTPDHLNRHKTLENYFQIKASLVRRSPQRVFNGDDPALRQQAQIQAEDTLWQGAIWTSLQGREGLLGDRDRGAYLENGWVMVAGEPIVALASFPMQGRHNHQNLLMSVAVAKLAGIDNGAIARAVETFAGVPHRLERICFWQGIEFINDSKATNYDAAEVGLNAVPAPAILIAGGEPKAGDDTAWLQAIQQKAAAVVLIGEAAPAFARRLEAVGYTNYHIAETMERAVPQSADLARQYNARVVLLSPACASFDQYANFEQRGDRFRALSEALCQELVTES